MTDPSGRRARWSTAMVVAPGAAAVLGASVWWASGVVPTTAATPTATKAPVTTSQQLAPRAAAVAAEVAYRRVLARAVAEHRHNSTRLTHELLTLRHEMKNLLRAEAADRRLRVDSAGNGGGAGVAVTSGSGGYSSGSSGSGGHSSGSSGSGGSGGGSGSSGGAALPAPPVMAQPAPAAPPVRATTGASGKP